MTTSPLQLVTSQSAASTPPHIPPCVAVEAEKEIKESLSVPYTPTSSNPPSAASSSSPSRRHSAHATGHRKANSLSGPAPSPNSQSASKPHSRSLSLRESSPNQFPIVTQPNMGALEAPNGGDGIGVVEGRGGCGEAKRESVMVTPPDTLPPSPPLTNNEMDGEPEPDIGVASEEPARSTESQVKWGEDILGGRRDRAPEATGSREATTDDHPLTPGSSKGVRLDATEPRPRLLSKRQSRQSTEVDVLQPVGITQPFEVVRRPKRTTASKPPRSSYYIGPPTGPTAYTTPPCGQIGVHHPREIVRIERDYDHGELVQFSTSYPLELQGRITPTQFLETINALNEGLIRAHSLVGSCVDNTLAILTLWISSLFLESTYNREMKRLQQLVDALNAELYNPQGLNILWPRKCAFLFLEIEYY